MIRKTNYESLLSRHFKNIGYNPHNTEKPFWLLKSFCIILYWEDLNKEISYQIPEDFISDGCTLKFKMLRLFFGCQHTPEYLIGSIIHDYFCCNRHLIDRKSASDAWEYILLQEGADSRKVKFMKFWVDLYQKYWRKWG